MESLALMATKGVGHICLAQSWWINLEIQRQPPPLKSSSYHWYAANLKKQNNLEKDGTDVPMKKVFLFSSCNKQLTNCHHTVKNSLIAEHLHTEWLTTEALHESLRLFLVSKDQCVWGTIGDKLQSHGLLAQSWSYLLQLPKWLNVSTSQCSGGILTEQKVASLLALAVSRGKAKKCNFNYACSIDTKAFISSCWKWKKKCKTDVLLRPERYMP